MMKKNKKSNQLFMFMNNAIDSIIKKVFVELLSRTLYFIFFLMVVLAVVVCLFVCSFVCCSSQ